MEFHRKIHGMRIIENPLQWDILGYILWSSNMASWKIPDWNDGFLACYSWENHRTKWTVFQLAMFDYQMVNGWTADSLIQEWGGSTPLRLTTSKWHKWSKMVVVFFGGYNWTGFTPQALVSSIEQQKSDGSRTLLYSNGQNYLEPWSRSSFMNVNQMQRFTLICRFQ